MVMLPPKSLFMPVALLAEGVDRNKIALTDEHNIMVALLAEGVDRNLRSCCRFLRPWVALLAEGVDRNGISSQICSARSMVALLAEGVDRNMKRLRKAVSGPRRPPRGGRG